MAVVWSWWRFGVFSVSARARCLRQCPTQAKIPNRLQAKFDASMSSMMADLRGELSPAHPDVGRYTKVAPSDTSQPSSAIGAAAVSLFLRAVQSLKKLVLWVSTRTHMLQVPWDRAAAERVAAAAVVAEQARGNAHGTRLR